ncbi:MAG: PEGA domain-containing protein [Acidobacteriota bacterium]|nr:MAG: PEGA domain-containing protein [Acidobacteriota bacterium]
MKNRIIRLSASGLRGPLCLLLISFCSMPALAQQRTLPEEDWYGDIKRALAVHYVGKKVRVTLPIPATRNGVEVLDGAVLRPADARTPEYIAQPGDELIIKSMRVTENEIEVVMGRDEPPPKRRFPNPFAIQKVPRISLRYSHELNTRDLTIENINRHLALVVDVSALVPRTPAETTASVEEAEPGAAGSPGVTIVGALPDASICELTIESVPGDARVYIDGSFSGNSPRTLRLGAGEHVILIVLDGYGSWERKLILPGGKAAVLRAEISRK